MRPHTGAVDHHVGANGAELGAHAHGFAVFNKDFLGRAIFKNARTPAFRALGQRLCGVDGVGASVFGQKHAPHDIGHINARPHAGNVRGAQGLHFEPKTLGHGRAAFKFLQAGQVGGNGNRAGLAKAGRLAGFLLQRSVQVGGVLRQAGQVVGGPQLAHQAGGVPGGAAGQLLAFKQDHVGTPTQSKVIRQAASDDATAHNDHAGLMR